jgi:hypothetical protein
MVDDVEMQDDSPTVESHKLNGEEPMEGKDMINIFRDLICRIP